MRSKRYILVLVCVAVLVLLGMWLWLRPKAIPLYRVIVLPSLGGSRSLASAINDRGQIVGYSQATDGSNHLCRWDPNGNMQDLGPALAGRTRFYLNDVGQIAGTTRDPNGNEIAFIWDPTRGLRTLGTLGGADSVALGLNNRGQVVGWSRLPGRLRHAFVWDETAGMRDLGPARGDGEARAINDSGLIVADGPDGPTLWTSAGPTPLAELLQGPVGFSDINNRGYMAGRQSFPLGRRGMVLWRLGDLPQVLFPIDYEIERWRAINDANQVLFTEWHHRPLESLTAARLLPSPIENYLWDPNLGRIALDPQVPTKRGETLDLFDLNNSGYMVGRVMGRDWKGRITHVRPVLLEPIPERWGR